MTTFHNFGPVNKFASAEWLNELRRQETEDEILSTPAPRVASLSELARLAHDAFDEAARTIKPLGGSKTRTHTPAPDDDQDEWRPVVTGVSSPVLTYSKDWLLREQAPRMPTDSTKENT